MAQRLAWVAIAVLAAYAVFIGGAWFGIYQPVLRLISIGAAAVALTAWAYLCVRDPSWRPRSFLLPAIAACLASLAISSAFSRFPGISLEYLAYAVLLAALYLLLVQLLAREFFRRRFIALAAGLFGSIVVVYLALTISHWANWLTILGRVTVPPLRPEFESLTFGNPSTVLTMVAMLAIPLVAAVPWTTRRGALSVALVLGLTAAVALVSGSRAGWLALGFASLVAAVLVVALPAGRQWLASGLASLAGRMGGRLALLVVGVAALAAIVLLGPGVLQRISAGGEANRLAFARIALELFAQSPIVGTGPGTWVIQRPALTQPDDVDEYIPHAHNVYAQTLGELGIVGAIAGVVLVASLLALVIGAVRDRDATRRRWGWATAIGLVYFAAHQVLDFYPNFPAVLFAAAVPVAFLDATRAPVSKTARSRLMRSQTLRAKPLALGGAVLALAVVLLAAQELPALESNVAVDRANAGDWASADAPARRAAAQDGRVSAYLFTAGLTAAHAGDHRAAKASFLEVTQRDDLPEVWLNLAAEQAALGEVAGVPDSIRAALRIGRQRPAVSVAAGDLALRVGDRALALEAFTSAVLVAPSFLGDPWWDAESDRAAFKDLVVTAAMASAPPHLAWELALMSGDATTARAIAATPGLDPLTIDFVDAWADDEVAYGRLIARCSADSLQLTPLAWCARIEGRRGNIAAANDYRYLANAQIGGAYRIGAELRVATTSMVGRSLEGNPAIFWGTYTYRRFTPWDVLVPSLVHLTLE